MTEFRTLSSASTVRWKYNSYSDWTFHVWM